MLNAKRYSKATRRYDATTLKNAVLSVKERTMTISLASREFFVPRKTLDDHLKKELNERPGPQRMLDNVQEDALVNYLVYSMKQGFPLTRSMVRRFVISLCNENPNHGALFNLEKGPSDEWFRKFLSRHPILSEKEPQVQDRARSRMSNETVINQFFQKYSAVLSSLGLENKPGQIFNCDETGWSGKEKSRQKVFGLRGEPVYQQSLFASGHITGHLCVCANGTILPSFIIFEKTFPHTSYRDGVPGNWLYGFSESGYMDSDLFVKWFSQVFIPNCGSARPVLLLLDNHESHLSIEVIKLARENQIELLGFPAHTTHILQPLDVSIVSINGPLKCQVYKTAINLGFINKHQIMNKAKFPAVLSSSIDTFCSPANVKSSFRKSGIFPVNSDAIDKRLLVPPHSKTISDKPSTTGSATSSQSVSVPSSVSDAVPSTSDSQVPSTSSSLSTDISNSGPSSSSSNRSICIECGSFLGGNPLVKEGLIPDNLAHIFPAVPAKPITAKRKMVTESRVITSDEFLKKLEDKEKETKLKKEQIEKRKEEREEKKKQKEAEQAEKRQKKNMKRKNTKKSAEQVEVQVEGRPEKKRSRKNVVLCKICRLEDPELGEGETEWVQCEICDEWCHTECSDVGKEELDNENFSFKCIICLELGEE